jgi:xylulose-5-phosphate/fructose-6-phosphate phosphoketolase
MEIGTVEKAKLINELWKAANYLSAGQIYLQDNPLLKERLKAEHLKPRLLGHWGTSPGLNLIYVHLNRLIKDTGANVLFMAGPGHGAPAVLANTYLEGSFTRIYPGVEQNEAGMLRFFQMFSTPGGIPSHVSAHTPGSIHEGGELGYVLAHAFGAAFDHPDLLVACVIGDGEAETGPLAGSWKSIDFLNPERDGAVLPILHLNGYKISSPTVMSRMTGKELELFFEGQGYEAFFVEGDDPETVHMEMMAVLDKTYRRIRDIQEFARSGESSTVVLTDAWPVILLRTPKGWTGPKEWKGERIEGTFRSHQVPLEDVHEDPEQLRLLENWLKSYHPELLFDHNGELMPALKQLIPESEKCMGLSPYANGGLLKKELLLPEFTAYETEVSEPGVITAEATKILGEYLRDLIQRNEVHQNFRLFCPDEMSSNRLDAVFEVTDRCSMQPVYEQDENISSSGRVMEVLSEHLCQGWLEGYLLTGRYGLFPCYEAFATIVDSMVTQHAKWLKMSSELIWRAPVASLNYLLSSHSWRQDHNGYSHQGPGFIDTVINKKNTVVRIYFPPDANCLLAVMDHCLKSENYVNVIVAGKQPELQWLDMTAAIKHCVNGASEWQWAGTDGGTEPDVVLAAAGDVPTLEIIAAAGLLARHMPELKVRVVNVVDLMCLPPKGVHPHGLEKRRFEALFTADKPVVFAFHGYVPVIHDLVHGRPDPERFHVKGYREEGTTTTPFDMVVLNGMSRFHLAAEALRRVDIADQEKAATVMELFQQKLELHDRHIKTHFKDLPEIENWKWEPLMAT